MSIGVTKRLSTISSHTHRNRRRQKTKQNVQRSAITTNQKDGERQEKTYHRQQTNKSESQLLRRANGMPTAADEQKQRQNQRQ